MITLRLEVNRRRRGMLVDVCESELERARGLLFRRRLREHEALRIPRCRAVHTIGLWYPIDVVFCAFDGTVIEIVPRLAPFRSAVQREAADVWELPPGGAERLGLHAGDRLDAA